MTDWPTDKSWISFPDNVVQAVLGLVLFQSVHRLPVLLLLSFFQLPQENFEVSELPDDWFMKQKSDIFLVVQSLNLADVAFLSSFPVSGLPGIDSLQNAEATKVLKEISQLVCLKLIKDFM